MKTAVKDAAKCSEKGTSNFSAEYYEEQYPSAEQLKDVCYEEYRRVNDVYDKIYEKVNIALVFCGVICLAILSSLDFSALSHIHLSKLSQTINARVVIQIIVFLCSILSAVFVTIAVIKLLSLMKGQKINVLPYTNIQNENIFMEKRPVANVWLIAKCIESINLMEDIIQEKQTKFDVAIRCIIYSFVVYLLTLILQKVAILL